MTPAEIEPATFRFVAQHLNHCATASFLLSLYTCSLWYFCQSFCCKLSFHLLILFDILHQSNCLFFAYYFSSALIIRFSILFNISFIPTTSFNWVFCTFAVTSLMNSSFASLSLVYQYTHTFTSLSLVFSLFLIFNLILALTNKWSDSMSAPHLILKSQTFVQWLLLTNVSSIWLNILLSGDLEVTSWMSLWWYHVPVTAKFLPRAKLIIHFPLSFVSLWRLCPPHAGYK